MAENVRARSTGDETTMHRAGAQLLGATGQLAVLGPTELVAALSSFNATGRHMGAATSQEALLQILTVVRSEVLPREPALDDQVLRLLLFEKPAA